MPTKDFLAIAGAAVAIGLLMIGVPKFIAWRRRVAAKKWGFIR